MNTASVSQIAPADADLGAAPSALRPAGHCDDDGAWLEFVGQYRGKSRADLGKPGLSDFALANGVYLASRGDLDLIVWQTAAKERIRWLSIQLAKALGREAAGPADRPAMPRDTDNSSATGAAK